MLRFQRVRYGKIFAQLLWLSVCRQHRILISKRGRNVRRAVVAMVLQLTPRKRKNIVNR